MIEVKNLTKRYAGRTAVDDISFSVGKGEIVGFLGPNGAGKSTTMKMLTCYLSATEGSATVAGHDIYQDSIEVRRQIGYMPENVPLYLDMRIQEYLTFRAKLKGLKGRAVKAGVDEAMETCSLTDVRKKIIGTLSKGYRQRVGLADALSNKPELLILDEPTNGLDPTQIRQCRELIKKLGESHTILLSTHILSEVEMTCGRVIIIDQGKVLASDAPKNLVKRMREGDTVTMELKGDFDSLRPKIEKISGVTQATQLEQNDDWCRLEVCSESKKDIRDTLFEFATTHKIPLRELSRRDASLEDAFVNLVKEKRSE
ncbi:MAG: ATP-binding cassette domain-containing protein [Verrucomicrobiota bacterium]